MKTKAGRKGEKQKQKKKREKKRRKERSDRRLERGKEKGRYLRPVSYPFIYRIFRIPLLSSQYVRMLQFFRVSDVCVFFV